VIEPSIALLACVGRRKQCGALVVLDRIDFSMRAGEAVGIVGPNSPGETALLKCRLSKGAVCMRGIDVGDHTAPRFRSAGIVRSHQAPHPCGGANGFENVFVAATNGAGDNGAAVPIRCLSACRDRAEPWQCSSTCRKWVAYSAKSLQKR
jgi:branched-chain amino acid transport system ATP-binding protein